tara:strand:- start:313 stop:501 length:189 start_codon:yes stop_codon:yes gene_type:complete
MISNKFIDVSNKLTKLNKAFYNAQDLSFKKIWLDKWNEVAKSTKFIKERKFLLEVNGIANDN